MASLRISRQSERSCSDEHNAQKNTTSGNIFIILCCLCDTSPIFFFLFSSVIVVVVVVFVCASMEESDEEGNHVRQGTGTEEEDEDEVLEDVDEVVWNNHPPIDPAIIDQHLQRARVVARDILGPVPTKNVFLDIFDPLQNTVSLRTNFLRHPLFLAKIHCETELEGHLGCVNTLDYNDDGSVLVSGSDDTRLLFFKDEEGIAEIRPGHTANIFECQFRNTSVVSCDRGGLLCCTDATKMEVSGVFECNRDVNELRRIAQGSSESLVCFAAADNASVYRCDFRERHYRCINADVCSNRVANVVGEQFLYAIEQENYNLYVAGSRPSVSVLDIRNFAAGAVDVIEMGGEMGMRYVTGLCLSQDNRDLLVSVGGASTEIARISLPDKAVLNRYRGHINSDTVKTVRFGSMEDTVMSGSDCGNAFVWGKENAKLLGWFSGDPEICNVVRQQPGELTFACSGLSNEIRLCRPISDEDQLRGQEADTTMEMLAHNLAVAEAENEREAACPVQ